MKLSELVKEYRRVNDISQREFARRCGLSNSYISFIENERNPKTGKPITPTIEQYTRIADSMGVSLHALIKQLDDSVLVSLASGDDNSLSHDERLLVTLFRGADDRARKDALRTLEDHQAVKERTT